MEGVDDDFGDLYADIDVKTINDIPDFKQLYLKNSDLQTTASIEESNPSLIANDAENCIDLDSENESDSEDDLNIVLNDDDCPNLVTASVRNGGGVVGDEVEDGGGFEKDLISNNRKLGHDGFEHGGSNALRSESYYSQYKYVRPSAGEFTSYAKVDKSVRAALCLSQCSSRGDLDDTTCSPTLAQSGYSFSLPWHKPITDINIDTFELKPWRSPGVDITDFFNYGFNEESWKQYCTSLDQIQRQASMRTRIPVYETSRHSRARRAKFEHEVEANEAPSGNRADARVENGGSPPFKVKVSDREARHLELPKGRAILIEGSSYERRPSMDIRRPRNQDSDVVIQITVQDSMEDSGSGKKESGYIESTICETSETERFNVNDGRDFQSCGGNSEDELPLESPEGSDKRSDILDAHKRCAWLML
ncbi:Pre-mRNA polyadenylation factor Fip1 domain [Dillenia turbinata]|uniref:Pre-mRNA polyadenylation factor Fip1 domain n=1 Tax=Dillenia turbinata TaxID=194707 RepID=A0AAN8V9U9_9MAGN